MNNDIHEFNIFNFLKFLFITTIFPNQGMIKCNITKFLKVTMVIVLIYLCLKVIMVTVLIYLCFVDAK